MQEIIGHILFCLLVFYLFYPMIYFFIDRNSNKIEQNIDEYERNNKKRKEIR